MEPRPQAALHKILPFPIDYYAEASQQGQRALEKICRDRGDNLRTILRDGISPRLVWVEIQGKKTTRDTVSGASRSTQP